MTLQTVSAYEIERRISAFQAAMASEGIGLSLVRQAADIYYFTGTVQDGHLFVPASGEPLFLVWRSFERAVRESPLHRILPVESIAAIPDMLRSEGIGPVNRLGLEMDVMPVAAYFRFMELFSPGEAVDVSPLIRRMRAVKSQWEIGCIRRACQKAWGGMETAAGMLSPGVTDLDVAVAVESYLRKAGHPGVVRMRMWNHDIGMDQVLTGPAGAMPAWTNTPAGGRGQSAAYGMGASGVAYEPGYPFTVDIAGYHMGYICDQTRTFTGAGMDRVLEDALELAISIEREVERLLRPGVECGSIYDAAVAMASDAGMGDWFMGTGRERVRFVGHGVGVELDEYPFLAKGNPMRLQAGMVVAVEPKFCIPGKGMVGVEDTYLVTGEGCQRLTLGPPRL